MAATEVQEPATDSPPGTPGRPRAAVEAVIAAILVLIGMAMTTYAAVTHLAVLVAPGSGLSLLGGAWLGNALARLDVRLFPATQRPADEETR